MQKVKLLKNMKRINSAQEYSIYLEDVLLKISFQRRKINTERSSVEVRWIANAKEMEKMLKNT